MRHTRDKHGHRRKCPFCRTIWTRPERIRSHVLKSHRNLLSDNEQEEIGHLRGLNNTIRFLAQCGRIPSGSLTNYALGIPQPFQE